MSLLDSALKTIIRQINKTQTAVFESDGVDFVKGGTVDQLKGLAAASSDASLPVMYSGTVGPRDMLITPAGWIFYEQVGNSDVVGVKVNYMARHDLGAFETLSRLHLSVGKPCTMVDEAIASIRKSVI